MLRLPVLLLAALLPTFAAAGDAAFLRPGERLELRLGYGWFGTAGLTTIETVREEHPDGARLRIHVATASRGLVDTLYPVANDSESVLDAATGRPLTLITKGKNGRRLTEKTTTFDYAAGHAVHVNAIRPQHNATVALPPEPAYDLMVALLQTRDWRLKVGESRRINCVNDKEFFTLEVTALSEDRVKTPTGTFDAIVLEPKPVGAPVGFFKKGGALKVWISRGDRPQIVRLDTKTKIGTVTALLAREETIQPPAADTTATPVAADTPPH
ncbi:MAG TPA: DUF3108 domain-containing protein [Opitutaceae bacterium]|nr:DUF3108 domain-containing protein [Opitutaceae bacterium]